MPWAHNKRVRNGSTADARGFRLRGPRHGLISTFCSPAEPPRKQAFALLEGRHRIPAARARVSANQAIDAHGARERA